MKTEGLFTKDRIIVGLLWIITLICVFLIMTVVLGLVLEFLIGGYVPSPASGLVVLFLFAWIYKFSTKKIKQKTGKGVSHILLFGGAIGVLFIILLVIGVFSVMLEPSFEDEQEELYTKNIQDVPDRTVPNSNEDGLYKTSSGLVLTQNSTYNERIKALHSYAYGDEINCTYPKEQVGRTCCIRSSESPAMCRDEYETLLKRYDETEELTTEGQIYNLNSKQIELPGDYYMLEDVSIGGENVDVLLGSNDLIGNYYEIKIIDKSYNFYFTHKELSYYVYNTLAEYFNSTISEITFYTNGKSKISYFDYYLVDDSQDVSYSRYALVERNKGYVVVVYSGSNKDFINEANLITDSLN